MGGAEKVLQSLVDAMIQRGDAVTICSFEKDSNLVVRDGMTHINFMPHGPLDYSISALKSRGKFSNYDVAFAQHYYHFSSVFAASVCRRNCIPLILKPIGIYGGNGILRDFVYDIVDLTQGRYVLRNASLILPTTLYEARLIESKGIPSNKVKVIRSGINLVPRPDNLAIDEFRLGHHLADNNDIVLFVGRAEKSKGVDVLLKAVLSLKPKFPSLKCLLAGPVDPRFRNQYSRLFDELGDSLVSAGPLSGQELASAYWVSQIFCLPSRSELASLSLREAGSAGLPAIVTDVGGNPEFVSDGQTGFVIPPNDPHALSEKIEILLKDLALRRRMGEASRIYSRSQTTENYVRQTLETFDSAVTHAKVL